MAFQVSPGVNVSEIDLTTSIPAVSVSTGAIAGAFNWGPVEKVTLVTSEVDLVSKFGKPDANTFGTFFTAANFLAYSNDLRVVRQLGSGAKNAVATSANPTAIKNYDEFVNNTSTNETYYNSSGAWVARYPGALGNSLKVFVFNGQNWAAATALNDGSDTDAAASAFEFAPATSPYVLSVTGLSQSAAAANDEIHIAVMDSKGYITGVANTILEKYQSVSVIKDAKTPDGSSNYYKDVILRNSKWVYSTGTPASTTTGWGSLVNQITWTSAGSIYEEGSANTKLLSAGLDGTSLLANTEAAFDVLANPETVDISLVMAGDAAGNTTTASYASLVDYVLTLADTRKDCVAFVSPMLANVTVSSSQEDSVVNFLNSGSGRYTTSYGVFDSGWKYQYDKYNDVYRWVPLNGDVAGLCARTDNVRDPWWSPAGLQRGTVKNVVKLAFNPNKTQRDVLYKAGVNPVVSFPGEGTILFGDKTFQNRPSAFDRINVRRLFIVLEKAIARAARSSLFEFNDTFTRAQFVNLVEPFLRTVKARRGIYDYKVVCDATNNTPEIIDSNQFVGDIYIKPARSINFIQLNFVAVRTGVSFNEVVGKF